MKRIQRIAGYSLLASSVFLANTALGDEQPTLEEVVITGSYIKGSPNDAPSPIQTLTREDILSSGVSDVSELIRNLAIASGSDTSPSDGTRFNGSSGSGLANVNLRGLGATATLVLLDGKRMPFAGQKLSDGDRFVDINSIPVTMLERVEVLKDGGSATYGSDAIAGVVNFITRDEFVGFELTGKFQDVTKGDQTDATYGAIFGWESEDSKTNIVIGGEMFDRSQQDESDRKDLLRDNFDKQDYDIVGGLSIVGVGLPTLLGNPSSVDPQCETVGLDFFPNNAFDQTNTCNRHRTETNILTPEQQRESLMITGKHTFSDAVEIYGQASYYHGRSGKSNPVLVSSIGPAYVFPTLIGSLAPNPIARNGDLLLDPSGAGAFLVGGVANDPNIVQNGGQLFGAVPAALGGLSIGLTDNLTRVPGIDPQRNYDTGNDSVTTRFQIGVRGEFEIAGKDWSYDFSAIQGDSRFQTRFLGIDKDRYELALMGLGGEACTPNGALTVNEALSKEGLGLGEQVALAQAVGAARFLVGGADGIVSQANPSNPFDLEGLVVALSGAVPGAPALNADNLIVGLTSNNQGQGGCEFFNPNLTRATNPDLANSDELLRWIERPINKAQRSETFLDSYEFVLAGELFDLENGPVQLAVGYQRRSEGRKTDVDPIFSGTINSFGVSSGGESVAGLSENTNYDEDRDIDAFFFELQVPVLDNLDAQIAGRYEDYGGNIGSTFDPKLGIRWQATEDLVLRGSVGTSFRGPALAQINEGTGFSLEFGAKDFLGQTAALGNCVRTGQCEIPTSDDAASVILVKQGLPSPDLEPETATTFNFGAIWTAPEGMFEGLTVGLDYYNIEFEDKITDVPTQAFLSEELALFQAARAAGDFVVVSPTAADFGTACAPTDARFAVGATEAEICQVNPAAYAINGGNSSFGGNIARRGDDTAGLQVISGTAINTGNVQTSGLDLNWSYLWDNKYGSFLFTGNLSHVIEFKYSDFPVGQPDFDAAGFTNFDPNQRIARSMPDLRGNTSLTYVKGSHSAGLTMRFIGAYENNAAPDLRLDKTFDNYYAFDFRYTYSLLVGESNVDLTFGAIDMFEADVPEVKNRLGTDLTAFDRRGRRIYASATYRM